MPIPTASDVCLELARTTDSRIERYLLLRLAASSARTSIVDLFSTPAASAIVAVAATTITKMMERPTAPPPAN